MGAFRACFELVSGNGTTGPYDMLKSYLLRNEGVEIGYGESETKPSPFDDNIEWTRTSHFFQFKDATIKATEEKSGKFTCSADVEIVGNNECGLKAIIKELQTNLPDLGFGSTKSR